MKTLYRNTFIAFTVIGLFSTTGCKKQLDINVDPNQVSPEQATPALVLPGALMGTAASVGGDYAIIGALWAQYASQNNSSNQYRSTDGYAIGTTDFNRAYNNLYVKALKNYQFVIDKSAASNNWALNLMATVMKAYTMQVLVDLYDNVPYTEALQGDANIYPKADGGYTIYKDLIAKIDAALAKPYTVINGLDAPSDLVFKGDMNKWLRFANTLKLKMFLRMVNKFPAEAQTGATALLTQPLLQTNAMIGGFTDAPTLDNPLYEQNIRRLNTPENLKASFTLASYLIQNSDPRRFYIYSTVTTSTEVVGIHQGDYTAATTKYPVLWRLNQRPTDPVVFISAAETQFMVAEALERYSAGVGAKAAYDAGVAASFTAMGLSGAATFTGVGGAYAYPTAGTLDQKFTALFNQKWISNAYGVHFIESFFDQNRTGYPKKSAVYSEQAGYIPGQWVISLNSSLTAGKTPKRLAFPDSERSTNPNAPAVVTIDTPVWWAL
ncbi:MAG: SusD/RagB family nutrient-binding outer membrane lipoprotein [Chitinophagaceae bacterium]